MPAVRPLLLSREEAWQLSEALDAVARAIRGLRALGRPLRREAPSGCGQSDRPAALELIQVGLAHRFGVNRQTALATSAG